MKKKHTKIFINFIFISLWIIILELIITILIRKLELSLLFNISADAWIQYIGTIFSTNIAVLGIISSIYLYSIKEEEKEKPLLKISRIDNISSIKNEKYYTLNLKHKDYRTAIGKEFYIKIENVGRTEIKNFLVKDLDNDEFIKVIEFDAYPLQEILINQECIVKIQIEIIEGMSVKISRRIEFIFNDEYDRKYRIPIDIDFKRYNQAEKPYIYIKKMICE